MPTGRQTGPNLKALPKAGGLIFTEPWLWSC